MSLKGDYGLSRKPIRHASRCIYVQLLTTHSNSETLFTVNTARIFMTTPTPEAQLTDPTTVSSHLFRPKPNEPGLSTIDRAVTLDEVTDQIKNTLQAHPASIAGETLWSVSEYLSVSPYFAHKEELFPTGATLKVMVDPAYEGTLVRILSARGTPTGPEMTSLLFIKYLSDPDDAWCAARVLSDAMEAGR